MATRGAGKRAGDGRGDDPMLRGVIAALAGLIAGALHDIGKNGLSNAMLSQEAALTQDQRRLIDEHVAIAVRALGELPLPPGVLTAIAQHHERLDGSGYPKGLAGDEIAAESRILAVADTVEAMLHARPYRPAFAPEAVVHGLMTARGRTLDAAAVDAALALLR